MKPSMRVCVILAGLLAAGPVAAAAQPLAFEEVVRNLANPDPELRMSALRLLRDAQYPEALLPIVPLVNDPVEAIQLEAIAAELSFFLVEDVPAKSRLAFFLIERRTHGRAVRAFEMGPMAVWPKRAPAELVAALLQAVDDEDASVRHEAIYTLGVIGAGAIGGAQTEALTQALDHFDPAVRTAAARVIGRLRVAAAADGLMTSMNDADPEVRRASMRALGEIGTENALEPLTDQLTYHGTGDGASAALDALARIAHPSSAPLFTARLTDRDPRIRRAALEGLARLKGRSVMQTLWAEASADEAEEVRAAFAFALNMLEGGYVSRLVDFMDSQRMVPQVQRYLMELGPSIVPALLPRLHEPDATVKRAVIQVLGALGNDSTIPALTPLLEAGEREVADAARHAVERIKMRSGAVDTLVQR